MQRYQHKILVISLVVICSLMAAALTPGVVFAEGEAPEVTPPEAPVVEIDSVAPEVGDTVVQLAEAGAAIIDPNGAPVPLASQTALEILCDPDPWFYCTACAGGKSPLFATFAAAISAWPTLKGVGLLYVQGSHTYSESVILDASIPGSGLATLKGIVWDKTGASAPLINGRLEISHFKSGFTLQGLRVLAISGSAAIYFHDNIGTIKLVDISANNAGGRGIGIYNRGAISLNLVNASYNLGGGASLDNYFWDGVKYVATGGITITNSAFMGNGNPGVNNVIGLTLRTGGTILLNGVTTFGNNGDGLDIWSNGYSATIKNSLFSNNTANPDDPAWGYGIYSINGTKANIILDNVYLAGNEADGAFLSTLGNITLKKVTATNNSRYGVFISKSYDTQDVGAKSVTITDSSFSNNVATNLAIYASGAVRITNLRAANSTTESGLYINNTYAATPLPVTILGAVLTDNDYRGGSIISKGTITISGITATGNSGNGMNLENGSTGSVIVSSVLGLNRFNDNSGGSGLYIYTNGNVSLSSIQANRNASYGVNIRGMGAFSNVSLAGVEANGNMNLSYMGVRIETTGAVTLNRVTASWNGGEGISIDNDSASSARSVIILNSVANENGKQGVKVLSVGAITLSGVTASGNTLDGANLVNNVITLPATQMPQGITVSKSTFDNNGEQGLILTTLRKITLSSINASRNVFSGVIASNSNSTINSPIVVSGINRFERNSQGGLSINSKGIVTVSGVTSLRNPLVGLNINTTKSATVKNSLLEGNGYWGLLLGTGGTTILSAVSAIQNGFGGFNDPGVYIFVSTGKVYVYSSLMIGNSGNGLKIDVANPATDAYISSSTIVFGNDAGAPYGDANILIY